MNEGTDKSNFHFVVDQVLSTVVEVKVRVKQGTKPSSNNNNNMNILEAYFGEAGIESYDQIKVLNRKLDSENARAKVKTALLDSYGLMNGPNFQKLFSDKLFEQFGIGNQKDYSFFHKKNTVLKVLRGEI